MKKNLRMTLLATAAVAVLVSIAPSGWAAGKGGAPSQNVAVRASFVYVDTNSPTDLADVAAGRFDAFWEQRLSAWDIAAGILLVREAGGVVTDFAGRHVGAEHTALCAGNPRMHAWLLEMLAS